MQTLYLLLLLLPYQSVYAYADPIRTLRAQSSVILHWLPFYRVDKHKTTEMKGPGMDDGRMTEWEDIRRIFAYQWNYRRRQVKTAKLKNIHLMCASNEWHHVPQEERPEDDVTQFENSSHMLLYLVDASWIPSNVDCATRCDLSSICPSLLL